MAASGPLRVPYLNEAQRVRYEVTIRNGALYQQDQSGAWQPLNTGRGGFMFVMDGKGTLYAGSSDSLMHHSAFLAGDPVAAAGLIVVNSGRPTFISDESGHYLPTTDHTRQFIQELGNHGIDVSKVEIKYCGNTVNELAKAHWKQNRVYPEGTRVKPY